MNADPDRLYELVPAIYRLRDAEQGYPLRGLLRVISEQVNLVEADIARLYENWFIETCQDCVVPYIGELIGYTVLPDGTEVAEVETARGEARNRILIPRREVANTIHYRRRKGTLALLEDLAQAVAGWPARAVEFYRLLGWTQNINYLHLDRGRTVDVRDGDALDDINSAFDELGHTIDVRCKSVEFLHTFPRAGNIPKVGVFVWRLTSYSVTETPAFCFEEEGPNCFLFSVLGNDAQLFTRPQLPSPHPPGKLNLPMPIRRRDFETIETAEIAESSDSGVPAYYGDGKSLQVWTGSPRQPVPAKYIVPADLTDWTYRPLPGQVAVDPVLGRIAFPPGQSRRQGVWVSYYYGFSADIGGGEYDRPLAQPASYKLYVVGEQQPFARINDALTQWKSDGPANAVIEIADSGVYVEPVSIALKAKQTLQIRAANRKRPVLRLLDWQTSQPDDLTVTGEPGTWFTLDGLLITGRGVQVEGNVAGVTIRHSTLVPGWGLQCDCEPLHPTEPSLELVNSPDCISIEHSIIGKIQVDRDEVKEDPGLIHISDSIVDATSPKRVALGAPESLCAYAILTIKRSTVLGQIQTHAIALAENSIFMGSILACRRQQGCMRFCYAPPGSRTPRRYHCQPDLVEAAVADLFTRGDLTTAERDALLASERLRVEPEFNSTRYGAPTYCQLADDCACEIRRGADDESEMGVFHDLYQPQRLANLRTRRDDYTPAGMNAEIIYAS
ncbi:MAG: hypothetical protein ACRD3T_00130 [Terriglobia bacterium]